MTVIVDRRNLQFMLWDVLGLEQLLEEPRFAHVDRATIESVFDLAERLAEDHYLPCAAKLDANEPRFVDGAVETIPELKIALRAYAASGLMATSFEMAAQGAQMPHAVGLLANGILTAANLSAANYSVLSGAAANMIATFGNSWQKDTYLSQMVAGEWLGTMCLSEPDVGSSLGDLKTQAEPLGDGTYSIRGNKMWISGGDHDLSDNIVHLVLARLRGAAPGAKGISLFIVPKFRPETGEPNHVALAGLNHKMGQRGTTNCLLHFGETGRSIGTMVGAPNQGLAQMFQMMNEARIFVGYGAAMLGLAGYRYSFAYALDRRQGRRASAKDPATEQVPIIEHVDIRRMLMAQKAAVEGAHFLCTYCAVLVDRLKVAASDAERERIGLILDILTPVAKSWPAEHCLEANKWAIQVLGGYGYTRDHPVERFYRDNRLNHIHEGTLGIQGIDLLGRKVRMQDGAAFAALEREVLRTIGAAEADEELAPNAAALHRRWEQLRKVTDTLIAEHHLERALANATAYLEAFGTIVVAWLWLQQALTARRLLEDRAGADFLEGKLAACHYHFRYTLPDAATRLALVESMDQLCLSVTPEQLCT